MALVVALVALAFIAWALYLSERALLLTLGALYIALAVAL